MRRRKVNKINIITRCALLVGGLMIFCVEANAARNQNPGGLWLSGNMSMSLVQEDGALTNQNTLRLSGSSTLGWVFRQGFILGAQGLASKNRDSSDFTWALGPKAGFWYKGFEVSAAYLPFAQDNVNGVVRTGFGFAVNLGYTWQIVGPIRLGLLGTYWFTSMNDQNGVELNPNQKSNYFSPQLALGFLF